MRITKPILLIGFMLLVAPPISAQSQSNLVGAELLGRAGIYSANYERLLQPRVGVGIGLAYWRISNGNTLIVPLYASATPIGRTHSLYIAAGATVGISNETFWGSNRPYETATFGTVTWGYQFRSPGGFVIRPTVNLFYRDRESVIWPGFTIGHVF
ncbi:MAG: hypothetical protein HY646_11980 [Acidobacteria bacterium]|nr:hypothetical protein [Acidobacteriota bacterium]